MATSPANANDSNSEIDHESETSSVDGFASKEQMQCRIQSLQQENLVLKTEVETMKLRMRALISENQELRMNSVFIQAKAEQEEEYISNTLMKQIQKLKKEKESLALDYEHEEELLTNDLTRKLARLQQEKMALEKSLEREQESQVTKLNSRIEKLEKEVKEKQKGLEKLRREKVELENTLEQEQEGLVNRLWKKMERLEVEKKALQDKLDSLSKDAHQQHETRSSTHTEEFEDPQTNVNATFSTNSDYDVTQPTEPGTADAVNKGSAQDMAKSITRLKEEVKYLKQQLSFFPLRLQAIKQEELALLEENKQLRRYLQREMERQQEATRRLSESESSIEMDEERLFNDRIRQQAGSGLGNVGVVGGTVFGTQSSVSRCHTCGHRFEAPLLNGGSSSVHNAGGISQLHNAGSTSSLASQSSSQSHFSTQAPCGIAGSLTNVVTTQAGAHQPHSPTSWT